MNNVPISIILSTFNREEFVQRAIDNILNQTFRNFEFIIINNGSRDNTQQICENYQKLDNRIYLIDLGKNRGASKAKELGLRVAKGEFITFIDDDDICEKEMIDFLYCLAKDHNADISICGSMNDYGDHIEPLYVYDELLILNKVTGLEEFLKREKFHTAPPTKLFKRKLFEDIPFPNNVRVDDIHFIYKVFAQADKIVACGKPLYRFVKHGSNMTSFIQSNKLDPQLLDEYICMQKQRIEYLTEKVPQIAPRVRYAAWSYMISMCDKIKTYNCENCQDQFQHMLKIVKNNLNEFENSPFITHREKNLLEKHMN